MTNNEKIFEREERSYLYLNSEKITLETEWYLIDSDNDSTTNVRYDNYKWSYTDSIYFAFYPGTERKSTSCTDKITSVFILEHKQSECRKQPGSINLMLSSGIFYSCLLAILSLFESLAGLVETLRGRAKQNIMTYLLLAAVQLPFPSMKQGEAYYLKTVPCNVSFDKATNISL